MNFSGTRLHPDTSKKEDIEMTVTEKKRPDEHTQGVNAERNPAEKYGEETLASSDEPWDLEAKTNYDNKRGLHIISYALHKSAKTGKPSAGTGTVAEGKDDRSDETQDEEDSDEKQSLDMSVNMPRVWVSSFLF